LFVLKSDRLLGADAIMAGRIRHGRA
jgi:hypothetical protein